MQKNKFKIVIIAILIILIIIFLILIYKKSNNIKTIINSAQSENDIYEEEKTKVLYGEENNVEHDESGNRINNSDKIKEHVSIKGEPGLEIEGLNITSKNDKTYITGMVKNKNSSEFEGSMVTLNLLNEEGKSILKVGVYINKIESKGETKIETIATIDLANAYSYTAEKE